jgi:hypothetical protein
MDFYSVMMFNTSLLDDLPQFSDLDLIDVRRILNLLSVAAV